MLTNCLSETNFGDAVADQARVQLPRAQCSVIHNAALGRFACHLCCLCGHVPHGCCRAAAAGMTVMVLLLGHKKRFLTATQSLRRPAQNPGLTYRMWRRLSRPSCWTRGPLPRARAATWRCQSATSTLRPTFRCAAGTVGMALLLTPTALRMPMVAHPMAAPRCIPGYHTACSYMQAQTSRFPASSIPEWGCIRRSSGELASEGCGMQRACCGHCKSLRR